MPQNGTHSNNNSSENSSSGSGDELEMEDEKTFSDKLYKFMSDRGSPIEKIPIFDHKELDLYQLYKGVISRGGLETVIENKLWRQITNELSVDPERTDAGFRLRIHYLKYLYPYERRNFLRLDDDDFDYEAYERQISKSHTIGSRERSIRSLPARKKKMAHMNGGGGTSRDSSSRDNSNGQTNNGYNQNGSDHSSNGTHHNPHHTSNGTTHYLSINSTYHPSERSISERLREVDKSRKPIVGVPGSLTKNFKLLDVTTLKRYKKYHRLKLSGSTTKRELADAVVQHFAIQKIDEESVISSFLSHVRCSKENQREREQRRRNASRKSLSAVYDDRY